MTPSGPVNGPVQSRNVTVSPHIKSPRAAFHCEVEKAWVPGVSSGWMPSLYQDMELACGVFFCGWLSGLELLPCGIDVLLWSVRRKLDGFHWLELGSNGALVSSNLANVHLGPPITPACTLFLAGANPSTIGLHVCKCKICWFSKREAVPNVV